MHDTLRGCERDVEQARSKLSHDLATLRAPETFSSFADDLKLDALETKDAIIDQAKTAAQSKLTDFVEDLKARAAANPVAAVAIGAGIAWRLLRNPPIATALVGAGIYGLWRTNSGFQPHGRSNADYLQQGKQRLMEQAGDFAATAAASAKDVAADVGEAVSTKTTEMIQTAKAKAEEWSDAAQSKAQEWSGAAQNKAREWSGAAQNHASEWSGAAQSKAQEWSNDLGRSAGALGSALKSEAASLNAATGNAAEQVRSATSQASTRTAQLVRDTMQDGRDVLADAESRDKLLLGVAGVAVVAALGIACQRRMTEEV
jgi:hypothetical protein